VDSRSKPVNPQYGIRNDDHQKKGDAYQNGLPPYKDDRPQRNQSECNLRERNKEESMLDRIAVAPIRDDLKANRRCDKYSDEQPEHGSADNKRNSPGTGLFS
jgi:hypothetical protein